MKLTFSHFALARVIYEGLVENDQPLTYRELQPCYNRWLWDHGCTGLGFARPIHGTASFQQHIKLLRQIGMLADEWHCVLTPRAYRQMRLYQTWQTWPLEVPIARRGNGWIIRWKEALYALDVGSADRWRESRPKVVHSQRESG